jgi:DNA-binding NarL/FixJ family response regulator
MGGARWAILIYATVVLSTGGRSSQPPEPGPKGIDVAIIEDQRDIREGLAILIGGTSGYRVVGSFRSMEEALPNINKLNPDVVLVDIGLPGLSGIEGIRRLRERNPKLALLVLTIYSDDERIFEAICAGAIGYLLKKTPPARILENIREVVEGGAPMSPEVARRIVQLFQNFHPRDWADYHLSPTETRLLKLVAEGDHYKTAAARMQISVNTVSYHMRSIYQKLQVHSKSEAVAKALRDRLIQ